jgi:hypothetical protein
VVIGAATLAVVAFAMVQHRLVLGVALELPRLVVPACVGLGFGGILAQLVHQRAAQRRLSAELAAR